MKNNKLYNNSASSSDIEPLKKKPRVLYLPIFVTLLFGLLLATAATSIRSVRIFLIGRMSELLHKSLNETYWNSYLIEIRNKAFLLVLALLAVEILRRWALPFFRAKRKWLVTFSRKYILFQPTPNAKNWLPETWRTFFAAAFKIVLFGTIVVYILGWLWNGFVLLTTPNAIEYRDLALVQVTHLFQNGVNPYTGTGNPQYPALYGFLYPLLTSLVTRFFDWDLYFQLKLITLSVVLATAVLFFFLLKKETKSVFLSLLAFSMALTTSWDLGQIALKPDALGIFFIVLIFFGLSRSNSFLVISMCSIVTVAEFYTKAYFSFIFLPILVYELHLDWKKGIYYGLLTVTTGFVSLILVQLAFPNYFFETIIVMSGAVGFSISYFFQQTLEFLKIEWPIFILLVIALLVAAANRFGILTKFLEKQETHQGDSPGRNSSYLYYSILVVALGCLVVLGGNAGAWLSYYYQLALPPAIVLGLIQLGRLEKVSNRLFVVFAILLVAVSLYSFRPNFAVSSTLTSSESMEWSRTNLLFQKNSSKEMFLAPHLGAYLIKNGLDPVDDGHTEYLANLEQTKSGLAYGVLKNYMPDLDSRIADFLVLKKKISNKLRTHEYSLVAVVRGYHPLIEQTDLQLYYEKTDEAVLKLTGEQRWDTEFWVPRPGQ